MGGVAALGLIALAAVRFSPTDGTAVHPVPPSPSTTRVELTTYPCVPVREGIRRLRVSFRLVNAGSDDVRLLAVRPVLPMGGLIPAGATTMGGSCRAPSAGSVRGVLLPAHGTLLTMRLRLPDGCAAPLPVQAGVTVRAAGPSTTTTVPVLPDLAALHDPAC